MIAGRARDDSFHLVLREEEALVFEPVFGFFVVDGVVLGLMRNLAEHGVIAARFIVIPVVVVVHLLLPSLVLQRLADGRLVLRGFILWLQR